MERVLVTGATGFVGRHLVSALSGRGRRVRALVRRGAPELDAEIVRGDLESDAASLDAAVEGCDAVFHCAGAVGDRVTWERGRAVNVEGTRRIASAAHRAGVRRFVHVSTLGVYGVNAGVYSETSPRVRVREPYTDTKIAAEEAVEEILGASSTTYRIVRPGMIYGPGDTGMMPRLAEMLRKRVPMIGDGRTGVVLVHVDDVVAAMLAAAEHERGGRVFNVRGPDDLTWAELCGRMASALRLPAPRRLPRAVASTFAAVLELLERARLVARAPLTSFVVKLLTCERHYPIDALREDLGVQPQVNVADGIDRALAALGR